MNSKTVFITGGTSGMGLGLVNRYLQEGYRVGACSFEASEIAEKKFQESLKTPTRPENLNYYQADVTNSVRMAEVIQSFAKQCGRLDILIANAGINHPKAKVPDFLLGTKVIEVNVNGVLNSFGAAIPIMQAQGFGQLAAMSSVAGVMGALPGMAVYCASKSAVLSICETLSMDLRHFGIMVTALAPGFVDTPLTSSNRHAMPFRMSTEKAVDEIFSAIQRKKNLHIFPWPLRMAALVLRAMPRWLFSKIIGRDALGTGANQ